MGWGSRRLRLAPGRFAARKALRGDHQEVDVVQRSAPGWVHSHLPPQNFAATQSMPPGMPRDEALYPSCVSHKDIEITENTPRRKRPGDFLTREVLLPCLGGTRRWLRWPVISSGRSLAGGSSFLRENGFSTLSPQAACSPNPKATDSTSPRRLFDLLCCPS